MWQRFASNAAANVAAGGVAMAFQLMLTAITARAFDAATFARWALASSIAAMVPLFSASLSTVVTRRLLEARSGPDPAAEAAVLGAARQIATALSALAVVSLVIVACGLALGRPDHSPMQALGFGGLTLALTIGQVWQIGLQPAFGRHYAGGNNWLITRDMVGARFGALVALALALMWWPVPGVAAIAFAAGTWLALAALPRAPRAPHSTMAPPQPGSLRAHRHVTLQLLRGFAVWSLGHAAIQYAVPAFMSTLITDFNAFYFAFTLNLVVVGVVGAMGSALLAPIIQGTVREDRNRIAGLMGKAPAATAAALVMLMALLWLSLPIVIPLLGGGLVRVEAVRPYLGWLGFQTIARSIAVLFAVALSAIGDPHQLGRPMLFEIALTAAVAAPAGLWFGAPVFLALLSLAGVCGAFAVMWVTVSALGISRAQRRAVAWRFAVAQAGGAAVWGLFTTLTTGPSGPS
jgi:hypothetical protein